jgi:hypothetical protein
MWLVEGKLFINNEIRHFKCLVDPGEQWCLWKGLYHKRTGRCEIFRMWVGKGYKKSCIMCFLKVICILKTLFFLNNSLQKNHWWS